nr:MAG TPA: hypothetical protein [Caudoviricetes sp.]
MLFSRRSSPHSADCRPSSFRRHLTTRMRHGGMHSTRVSCFWRTPSLTLHGIAARCSPWTSCARRRGRRPRISSRWCANPSQAYSSRQRMEKPFPQSGRIHRCSRRLSVIVSRLLSE